MSELERKNYYDVLEIPPNASLQDIHEAYQRVKHAYAGDSLALYSIMSQDECDRIVEQIEEAYSILGTPDKRREYDKARGFNQENTPSGYNEKVMNRPEYQPRATLSEMLNPTSHQEQNRDHFQFSEKPTPQAEVNVSKLTAYQRFGLDYQIDTNFEQEIENTTDFSGTFLKKIREYKNVSIERMADMTRVSKTYIRNIENEEYDKLPAEVYTRGFVYQYAKCLKLNPNLVASSFLHHFQAFKNQK